MGSYSAPGGAAGELKTITVAGSTTILENLTEATDALIIADATTVTLGIIRLIKDGATLLTLTNGAVLTRIIRATQDLSIFVLGTEEAWNISVAGLVQTKNVEAAGADMTGLFFRADGLKMYLISFNNSRLREFDLATAWNISTAVLLQSFNYTAQENQMMSVFFRDNGLKMYLIGQLNDRVYEYNLSTAWNISTAVFLQFFAVGAQDTQPNGLFFRADGLKMYIMGRTNDRVYEYNLSTAWNISTAVFLQSFLIGQGEGGPEQIFFKPDGLKMFVIGESLDAVLEYNLSTAWNISTAVFLRSFSVAAQTTLPGGLFFRSDGIKMFVSGGNNGNVMEYGIPPPLTGSLELFTV